MGNACCVSREQPVSFSQIDFQQLKSKFENAGQGHIFESYDSLDPLSQQAFLQQVSQINPEELNRLFTQLVKESPLKSQEQQKQDQLEPVEQDLVSSKQNMTDKKINELRQIGLEKIMKGSVAVVILAGGQGTRLGFDHPKGMYDINLPSHKSIFQLLVERYIKIQMIAHQSKYLTPLVQQCKLLIMTSEINHNETVDFFTKNKFFGANKDSIIFFQQSVIPAMSMEGKILMEDKAKLALSPNGNGALFDAIHKNKTVLNAIKATEYVQVIGVDNVLNKLLDPLYIGFAVKNKVQAAIKCCIKRDWKEPVGVVVKKNKRYDVVEYSELSEEQAKEKDPQTGELKYNLGQILNFLLKTDKLLKLCEKSDTLNRFYHKAFKKVSYYDNEKKEYVKPDQPNAYKFELFIQNFLPLCSFGKIGVLKVQREEEFAPIKNSEGQQVDSPNTARELIYSQHTKWLVENGGQLESNSKEFEIDFLLSYEGEGLQEHVNGKTFKCPHYLRFIRE